MKRKSIVLLAAQAVCVVATVLGITRLASAESGTCQAYIIVDKWHPGTKYFWSDCAGTCIDNVGPCRTQMVGSYFGVQYFCTCRTVYGMDNPCEMCWSGGRTRWDVVTVVCAVQDCPHVCMQPDAPGYQYGDPPPDHPDPETPSVVCPCQ